MEQRRKILLALAGVLIFVVVAWTVFAPQTAPEPSYNGKALGEWVIQYGSFAQYGAVADAPQNSPAAEAADAIQHIGSNAIPYLVKWIRDGHPTWKGDVNRIAQRICGSVIFTDNPGRKYEVAGVAPYAFQVFGPRANGAIPKLSELLNHPKNGIVALEAGKALQFIGTESLPVFTAALTNKAGSIRIFIPRIIADMGTNALPAVPALINCLDDPNTTFRERVTNALLRIDPKALKRATQP